MQFWSLHNKENAIAPEIHQYVSWDEMFPLRWRDWICWVCFPSEVYKIMGAIVRIDRKNTFLIVIMEHKFNVRSRRFGENQQKNLYSVERG